jgi:hypothetical protein
LFFGATVAPGKQAGMWQSNKRSRGVTASQLRLRSLIEFADFGMVCLQDVQHH